MIGTLKYDNYAGSAYVFIRSSDGTWIQQAKITAEDSAIGNLFGSSVSLFGDTALIGAQNDDYDGHGVLGAAYVFVRSGTAWTKKAKLIDNSPDTMAQFGVSVSLSNSTALVGSMYGGSDGLNFFGAAYAYRDASADDDADSDGIADDNDQCPATASDDVVNSTGCSVVQLCPCDGKWKNRNKYMQCVQQASKKFMTAKLITKKERLKVMQSAAKSLCGRKKVNSTRVNSPAALQEK